MTSLVARDMEAIIPSCIVNAVSADSLAPLGAGLYAGTVVTRVGSHYDDVIMSAIASQITSLTVVYSTVY